MMDSLNGHTVDDVKKEISIQTKHHISNIRLFGSRITGGWKEDSDLDVAIKDKTKINQNLIYESYLGINSEIRFVEHFDISWLKDSI